MIRKKVIIYLILLIIIIIFNTCNPKQIFEFDPLPEWEYWEEIKVL